MRESSEPIFSKGELKRLKSAARRSHLAHVLAAWAMRAAAMGIGGWIAAILMY